MKEVWKDIKGYNGLYQVSNLGRIKSLKRKGVTKDKILKCSVDHYGYVIVKVSNNKKHKNLKVHRLIAQAFIPNPLSKPQVNHINDIKDDNSLSNLEWVTIKENVRHSFKINKERIRYGENHHSCKLKRKDVEDMRKLKKFFKYRELATIFNTSISNVSNIINNRSWKKQEVLK